MMIKKVIYLFFWIILGLILSFLAHALIEVGYLSWAESQKKAVSFYNGCTLHPIIQISLLVIGLFGGFLMGRFSWNKIYVEKAWRKKR